MKFIFFISFCLLSISGFAQENSQILKEFDSIIESSNSYQKYKVIEKNKLNNFRKEVDEFTNSLSSQIVVHEQTIADLNKQISNLKDNNKSINAELNTIKSSKDEINLLGLKIEKNLYIVTVWSIMGFLLLILVFFIIKYRNRNIVTQELKENLDDTTKEFEEYKHRSIEKQQKLGRELLDAKKLAQSSNNKK